MNLRNHIVPIVAVTWFLVGAAVAAAPQETAPKPAQPDDYLEGSKFMEAKDYSKALTAFRRGAEKGDARAQNALGSLYLQGLGVSKDPKLALPWIQKSADQGNEKAQSNLGLMYTKGDGVAQDPKLAMSWFEKAAAQGHSGAQTSLAAALLQGKVVPVNIVEAYKWMTVSGDERAIKLLDALEKKMTREQISEAKRRAADWTKEFKQRAALKPQPDNAKKASENTLVKATLVQGAATAKAPAAASMETTSGKEAVGDPVAKQNLARRSRSHLDARECLKLDDSKAIGVCAERFR